uniref:hypothetical protein n=1 Tax=Fulvivirga sp. TaxID=1931237 RepID=UPI00404994E8
MKRYFTNIAGLVVATIGFIGGLFWAFASEWEWEPIILLSGSLVHLIANAVALNGLKRSNTQENKQENNTQIVNNSGSIKKQVNIQKNKGDIKM